MKFAYLIEPPFNYRNAAGVVTGCDVELANHVADMLGVGFEPVEAKFAELLPGLAAGRWQMTTGLFDTEERRRIARFSRPIWALPDGLLVRKSNPLGVSGYSSAAANAACVLAVVRDQLQHRSAVDFGIPDGRILVFKTYAQAALAVQDGRAGAYASVARAHAGFIERNPDLYLQVVAVPVSEKPPAFGSFGFAKDDAELADAVDVILTAYLGSAGHRMMMARYGFLAEEVNLVA